MIIKYTKNNIDYILSNENLVKGDKVYPISHGRCCTDRIHKKSYYVHYEYDFRDFCSSFPDDPHVIEDLHYSEFKPEEVRTDHGYGPIESYYKILTYLNKSDYLVRIKIHPKTGERCLFVVDKISYSTQIYISDKECFAAGLRFNEVVSDKDLEKLKQFRLTGEIERNTGHLRFPIEHELTDII